MQQPKKQAASSQGRPQEQSLLSPSFHSSLQGLALYFSPSITALYPKNKCLYPSWTILLVVTHYPINTQ